MLIYFYPENYWTFDGSLNNSEYWYWQVKSDFQTELLLQKGQFVTKVFDELLYSAEFQTKPLVTVCKGFYSTPGGSTRPRLVWVWYNFMCKILLFEVTYFSLHNFLVHASISFRIFELLLNFITYMRNYWR